MASHQHYNEMLYWGKDSIFLLNPSEVELCIRFHSAHASTWFLFHRRHILAHYGDRQGTPRCVSFKPVLCVYSHVEAASLASFA